MARVLQGSMSHNKRQLEGLMSASYDYNYPVRNEDDTVGMNLKPGSKLHDMLRDRILERAFDSAGHLSTRYESWRNIDKVLSAYIRVDDAETLLQDEDERRPVSIVFPNTYAIMETLLSYLSAAFFGDPVFRYIGVGPEDTAKAILLQKVIQQQVEREKVILNLHTMFRDALAYGVGSVHPYWKTRKGNKPRVIWEEGEDEFGRPTQERIIEFVEATVSEGNALQNIDPYLMLPDPNVSISDIQNGEYFGWVTHTNLMDLLSSELDDGDMFNARYVKHLGVATTTVTDTEPSDRGKKSGMGRDRVTDSYGTPVDVITMYIKLIPEEWELGDGEYPELWLFELAGDNVITKAQPANNMHGMLPVASCAPEYDGYGIAPISRLEIQYGLQGVLDWLFNSHIANVRKALNDMLVVDPFMVNINDIRNPGPGKLIRTRRPVWGQGVKDAVQQLAIHDVTQGNMMDANYVINMMRQLSGSDSPAMGALRQGGPERLTSAEFQGTAAGAGNRMDRIARLISYQAMRDIAYMFASNTQQLMNEETYVRTSGNWPAVLQKEYGAAFGVPIKVDPLDLVLEYDIKIKDGSVPGSNFSESWIQLYQIIAQNPELAQKFDMVRIFKHIARNLGAKNVNEFERTQETSPLGPQVNIQRESDEEVQREVERGNMIPMSDVGEL